LENDFAQVPIIKSDPVVTYKETMTSASSQNAMTKSQNKHNRITGTAQPLHELLPELIENGDIDASQDVKIRGKRLVEEFDWEKDDTTKIWCFGPDNVGPNMVVDITKGVQYMNEIKESIVSSFQNTARQGVLCEENMRGMRFNVIDCELHTDAIHRGGGQIMPSARRLFYALEMLCEPTLLEPIFSCEITAPMDCMGGVYQSLNTRRGQVVEEVQISGTPLNLVILFLILRLKLSCQSQNHSVLPVCSEVTPKERLSHNVSSTIGKSLRDSHLLTKRPLNSFSVSERERDLRKKCQSLKTTWTNCDTSLTFIFKKIILGLNLVNAEINLFLKYHDLIVLVLIPLNSILVLSSNINQGMIFYNNKLGK
jgi:hypothetical protein